MYKYVSPTYIKAVPLADGWNSWFLYATDYQRHRLRHFAPRRRTGLSQTAQPVGPTTDFNSDIVYANGSFLQWPEGVQR